MKLNEEFRLNNLSKWKETIKEIFPNEIPKRYEWTNIEEIINILNIIGKELINRMMSPSGGGVDLEGAELSKEKRCINLISKDYFEIVKPKSLIFYSINEDLSWAYFRLETNELEQSDIYESEIVDREELTYTDEGIYLDKEYVDSGYYIDKYKNRVEITSYNNRIFRYLKAASFVIVAKASVYNNAPITTYGFHNDLTDKEFFEFMEKSYTHSKRKEVLSVLM